jgi:hypothetical protein
MAFFLRRENTLGRQTWHMDWTQLQQDVSLFNEEDNFRRWVDDPGIFDLATFQSVQRLINSILMVVFTEKGPNQRVGPHICRAALRDIDNKLLLEEGDQCMK